MQMIMVQFWFSSEWVYFAEITIQEAPRPQFWGSKKFRSPQNWGLGAVRRGDYSLNFPT